MRFTKEEIVGVLVIGSIMGLLWDASREPWRAWIDPIGDIIAGLMFVGVVIAVGKMIEKSWQTKLKRSDRPSDE